MQVELDLEFYQGLQLQGVANQLSWVLLAIQNASCITMGLFSPSEAPEVTAQASLFVVAASTYLDAAQNGNPLTDAGFQDQAIASCDGSACNATAGRFATTGLDPIGQYLVLGTPRNPSSAGSDWQQYIYLTQALTSGQYTLHPLVHFQLISANLCIYARLAVSMLAC